MDASDLAPLRDVSAADWLVAELPVFGGRPVDLVTSSFEAYVRIFHRPDQGLPRDDEPTTWSEVAKAFGTVMHPAAQFQDLTSAVSVIGTSDPRRSLANPLIGTLDLLTLPLLRDLVATHTTTPDVCWFALWDGWGSSPQAWRTRQAFRLPGRDYWLFGGGLDYLVAVSVEFENGGRDDESGRSMRALGLLQSPNIWWPNDHAWLVHSEIDYDSTIVGGTQELIDAIVAHPEIEAVQVDPQMSLYFNTDTVNGPAIQKSGPT